MAIIDGSTRVSSRARSRRRVGALAILAGLALTVAGCSASGSDAGTAEAPQAADGAGAGYDDAAPGDAGGAAEAAGSAGAALATTERQIVKNGEIYVTVDDPIAAAGAVADVVDRLGGRVDSREQDAGSEGRAGSAVMTVRVPADALDDAVDSVGELGEVVRYTESTKDVTDAVVDLDARISAAETSVDRVQEFLDRAANTTELLATERELSTRQGELESLRAQRQALRDQVSMSTLYVSLTAPGDAVIERPGPDTFVDGLGTGWRSLWNTLRTFAVVLGVLLPWLALAAVVATAVVVPTRRRRSRRTPPPPSPGLPTPPPAPPTPVPASGTPPTPG